MNGRRIYHARGKVLGGSSSINGQIFQRGNPLDYERWAADPGMATWDYAHCLPYFKKMETCLAAAADDPWRGHDGPLVLERGPATNPLFTAFFAACQEAGYHLTEDVNGYRQEGFAAVRPEHPPRPAAERRPGLPAPGDGPPQPRGPDPRVRHAHPLRGRPGGRRRRGEGPRRHRAHRRRRGHPRGRGDQLAAAPPALGRRPGGGPRGARDPGRPRPARRRRPPPGPPRGLHPVQEPAAGVDAAVGHREVAPPVHRGAVAVPPPRARGHEPLRGRRLRAQQRGGRVPEPDVPLPAAGDPLRRQRRGEGARLPGPRRPDVLGRPRHRPAQEHGPAGASGAPLQLPLDRAGPARVGRGGPRRPADPEPAGDGAVQRRRRPRRERP